jgi:hypothetical protein
VEAIARRSTRIDLSHEGGVLPPSIGRLSGIRSISAAGLTALPDSIGELSNLDSTERSRRSMRRSGRRTSTVVWCNRGF